MKKPLLLKILKNTKPKYYGIKRQKIPMVLCECVCGKIKEINLNTIRSGSVISCGCYGIKVRSKARRTHGLGKNKIVTIWEGMMRRCYNKNHQSYHTYGGRGIKVIKRWHNIKSFYKDILPIYKDGKVMDRKNNNGNYSLKNIRFISQKENCQNRNNNLKFKGECASEACRRLGGGQTLIKNRIASGWSKKKAFTTPIIKN